jgi:hypothetical protein
MGKAVQVRVMLVSSYAPASSKVSALRTHLPWTSAEAPTAPGTTIALADRSAFRRSAPDPEPLVPSPGLFRGRVDRLKASRVRAQVSASYFPSPATPGTRIWKIFGHSLPVTYTRSCSES